MIDVNKPLENPVLKELFSRIGKNQKSDLELQNKILDEIIMQRQMCIRDRLIF